MGFEGLANKFFRLRDFCGSYDKPVTPALIDSLREYTPDVDCDIIYTMDNAFRAGAAAAKGYWENN